MELSFGWEEAVPGRCRSSCSRMFCHLADDGTQLGQIVRIGIGGDQGLHDAEGEHNHRNQLVRRQAAVHGQQTADGQDAHQCGGKMAMPADWPKMQLRIQSMKQSAPSLAADTNLA